MGNFQIYCGNAKAILSNMNQTVHCVVTSPPYYKKRSYGDNPSLEIGSKTGKKEDVDDYIASLVEVFNAVPLHPKGSVWVNIGDKRNGSLKMAPEKFALEMLKHGWNLADNVIWAKIVDFDDGTTNGGCMTEPAKTRLNGNGWEYMYRFTKTKNTKDAYSDVYSVSIPREGVETVRYLPKELMSTNSCVQGRALHNVWRVHMGQTKKKHYAVYPTALVERPVAMTCPMRIVRDTDELVERQVEWVEYEENRSGKRIFGKYNSLGEYDEGISEKVTGRIDSGRSYIARKPFTKGWSVFGSSELLNLDLDEYNSGIVLDPFCGSGTTGEVALKMGRSFIGIDLYEEFSKMTEERCQETQSYLQENDLDAWKLHA
jgi:site-specific DNA-methyltransferase (adenine-specific)